MNINTTVSIMSMTSGNISLSFFDKTSFDRDAVRWGLGGMQTVRECLQHVQHVDHSRSSSARARRWQIVFEVRRWG